jgi:tryptophan synthase alpha chain
LTSISQTFDELKQKREAALIAYLTVGYPQLKATPRFVRALIDGGADIIELGVPFSDPIADGPTIQNAVTHSLSKGTRPRDALEVAATIREKYDTPLVLMTYYNPIFRIGLSKFISLAQRSGISGFIVPDLPVEESADYEKQCLSEGVDTIYLASPSTTPDRMKKIAAKTKGYLYLISLYGVTGERPTVPQSALALIRESKRITGPVPLAVGFGISKPEHVKQVIHAGADGAIVGSAFIKTMEKNSQNISRAASKLNKFARIMKKGTKP